MHKAITLEEKYERMRSVVETNDFPKLLEIIGKTPVKCEMWVQPDDGFGRKYWSGVMVSFKRATDGSCKLSLDGYDDKIEIADMGKVVNENMTNHRIYIEHEVRLTSDGNETGILHNGKKVREFGIVFKVRQLFVQVLGI